MHPKNHSLNETARQVLRTAWRLDVVMRRHSFNGTTIQRAGWPDAKSHCAKGLGISQAIQTLKRRGFVASNGKRWFHLTEQGMKFTLSEVDLNNWD